MSLLDALLQLGREVAFDFVRRELQSPTGWEADPRTKTIRRKRARPTPPAAAPKSSTHGEPEVIDLCPRCYAYHPGEPCRRKG